MNKFFTKVAAFSACLAMAIGVGVAVGSGDSKDLSLVNATESTITFTTSASNLGYKSGSASNKSMTVSGVTITFSSITGKTNSPARVQAAKNSTITSTVFGDSITAITLNDCAHTSTKSDGSFSVSCSANGSSWTDVYTTSSMSPSQGNVPITGISYASGYKYFKITVGNSRVLQLSGIVVTYGSASIPATGISLNKTSTTITAGSSETLTATVTPNTATDKTVSWSVSPTGQGVSVSNGTVSTTAAATPGNYTVTASANGGTNVTATCTVTVQSAAAESITVTGTSSMYVGDASISLTATPSNFSPASYTWTSSNPGVATISGTGATGTVSAVAKGTTNITASAQGTSGTVVSNSFTLTVKQFSIALSTSSVSMKASKSTTVTVTPTDATGTVVVTATSNDTSVATTSVSGTTITINSGSDGSVSTTITVSAKDNNGASGYHTAANQTISVEVTAGYIVGAKVTTLPSETTLVYLISGDVNGTPYYLTSSINTASTSIDDASLFKMSSTATLRQYNPDTDTDGNYVFNGGSNTTVSSSANSTEWKYGMSAHEGYEGLLQQGSSTGRFLTLKNSDHSVKAFANSNLGVTGQDANTPFYAYLAVSSTPTVLLSGNSVSGMKDDSDTSLTLTISNFTATGLNVTYKDDGESSFSSSSDIASVTCGHSTGNNTVSVSLDGVGSTIVKLSVTRGGGSPIEKTFTVTVAARPASLTLVNGDIDHGEIEVKRGGTKQISFTALDTDGGDYSINYSGITASSSNSNVSLSGSINMVLNGDHVGDAVVTCTITATADWQSPITQTLTVHVIEDYNERNVSITVINNANVEQGDTLVIADHISAATATTHFGTNNNPIEDNELLFSYTNDRSAGVTYSNFVWDVTDPDLNAGETETRTVYVFVTFNESYAGTSFTAVIEVADRPVVGLKVDGVSKNNNDDINLSLPRNSTYNFSEHVTVDPVNATQSHEINYVVEDGGTYVSVSNGVMTIGSKIGDTVACVSASPAALSSFKVYFRISITREAMTITADLPEEWNLVTDESELEAGDQIIITSADSSVGMISYVSGDNNVKVTDVTVSGTTLSDIGSAQPLTLSDAGSGKFYINDGTYYLYAAASDKNQLKGKDSQDSTNGAWEFEYSSDHMSIIASGSSNRNVMQYNSGNNPPIISCYATASQNNLQVYKLSGGAKEVTVTDELFNVVNGAMSLKAGSTTLYDLRLCDASGNSFDTSAWNTLGNSFTSAIKDDNKLAYARADSNGNEIEQFLAVYDYVIGKKASGNPSYASANDFLGRIDSGKISASARVPLISTKDANTAIIVVVVSIVAMAGVGGYFLLRKRKED